MNQNQTPTSSRVKSTGLGELISVVYSEFLAIYGDPELASVAAAAVINDLLSAQGLQGSLTVA